MKINWTMFVTGGVLALPVLFWYSLTLGYFHQPEPVTVMDQQKEYMYTCENDSENKAFCECSYGMIEAYQLESTISGVLLYQETKELMSDLCMIDA